MEDIGFKVLAWFLVYGTMILTAVCAALSICAGLLCVIRLTARRRFLSLICLLAAEVFLIGNFQFNMWLFEDANKRTFSAMCENLKKEPMEGKIKNFVASKFGRPLPMLRFRSNNLETWSYSPGPFMSYGGMDTIHIEFKGDVVNRWYVSWF